MAWRRFHSNSVKRDDNGPNHSRVVQILKSGSWLLTFALGRLENFTFLTGSELWAPFNFHCGEKWNWRLGEEWCWRPKRVLTCMKWSDRDAHNLVVCFNLTWKEFRYTNLEVTDYCFYPAWSAKSALKDQPQPNRVLRGRQQIWIWRNMNLEMKTLN